MRNAICWALYRIGGGLSKKGNVSRKVLAQVAAVGVFSKDSSAPADEAKTRGKTMLAMMLCRAYEQIGFCRLIKASNAVQGARKILTMLYRLSVSRIFDCASFAMGHRIE